MPARRIIPCLDVKDGRVVKGVQFRDHRDAGDIVEQAMRYREEGADELVFYDITASAEGRTLSRDWVQKVASVIDIPFAVAGGLRGRDEAASCLEAGADKVSINSPALERPELITELAREFGSQCVVVGVDTYALEGDYFVHQYTGRPDMSRDTGRRTLDWVREAVIADHLAVGIQAVRDDAHFADDLGADSLDMIELSMRFEEALDISIDDHESEGCATVADALSLLRRKTAPTETV